MRPEPVAAYRLQLGPSFGFDQAAAVAPYLAGLGVSHLYLSPCLQAASGSAHGYDVVDPTQVNRELGGAEGLARLRAASSELRLGELLDLVPNHMAIGRENPWWWDVLENGPSSPYAFFFDVDWVSSEERWPNKVLLPVLANQYGRVLDAGELRLSRADAGFKLQYKEERFPLDPSSLSGPLGRAAEGSGSALLGFLAQSYARLPRPTVTLRWAAEQRHRDTGVIQELLARHIREDTAAAAAVDAEVKRLNADHEALHELLELQNYRLALWKTAARDLGYRRFFNINSLAALRMEDEEVFRVTHRLPLSWYREGSLHGLRVDHPDGLRDPLQYFQRLRAACPEAWIVAEKVLQPGEELPSDWPVDGTTGYEFLNAAGGLFVDPAGEAPLTRLYAEFTGEAEAPAALRRRCRADVLANAFESDLHRLTALFIAVCERHGHHRDYTRHELHQALREVAAFFPVYRTYARPGAGAISATDAARAARAAEEAAANRPDLDPELFRFLGDILVLKRTGDLEGELASRFQQLTAPAMAKGVEDSFFYRYTRLACLNEVGGDPARFGVSLEEYHRLCERAAARRHRGLLATSTHDTKRSEDVRARLALLSEIPAGWGEAVKRWASRNERHHPPGVPERSAEYLFYQTLVGAWPIGVERLGAYMEKAAREAGTRTSWERRDAAYEEGLRAFVRSAMADAGFMGDVEAFTAPLVAPGRLNSLAQTLLKLASPGVPDLFQGCEVWDLSLVDPDNRRPVDFERRAYLLEAMREATPEEALARAEEGAPKLWLIHKVLRLRRERPSWFAPSASYRPLSARGPKAGHVAAFIRAESAAAVAPRLVLGLEGRWGETAVELPQGRFRDVLTGERIEGGEVRLASLLARFPVALLAREG